MKRSDWLWTFAIYFGADFSSDQNFALKRNFLKSLLRGATKEVFFWIFAVPLFLARRFELPPTRCPRLLFVIQTACSPHFLN
jgi:hypothetical protein